MTDRVYVRQIDNHHWQWRVLSSNGTWYEDIHEANRDQLLADLSQLALPLCLLLGGHNAVARTLPVDASERKLMTKILPYEIEEELIDAVEDLHFCFGKVENDKVDLVYLRTDLLQEIIEMFEPTGCEVEYILPDYFVIDPGEFTGILVLEDKQVMVKFNDGHCFTTELNIAQFVLAQLDTEENPRQIDSLLLVANSVESIAELKTCIPDAWMDEEKEIYIDEQLGSFWEYINPENASLPLNLRVGAFGRQIPLVRWWEMWKGPAYGLAAAFVLSLGVNFFSYTKAKSVGKEIRTQIQQVYLKAVPNGRVGDEEKRLRTMLKGKDGGSSSAPTNLMFLLSAVTKSMQQQKDIELSNFRYSGDQRELQVNFLIKGLGELGQFRDQLTANGLQSGSPRTSRLDDKYQASMKISEKK